MKRKEMTIKEMFEKWDTPEKREKVILRRCSVAGQGNIKEEGTRFVYIESTKQFRNLNTTWGGTEKEDYTIGCVVDIVSEDLIVRIDWFERGLKIDKIIEQKKNFKEPEPEEEEEEEETYYDTNEYSYLQLRDNDTDEVEIRLCKTILSNELTIGDEVFVLGIKKVKTFEKVLSKASTPIKSSFLKNEVVLKPDD